MEYNPYLPENSSTEEDDDTKKKKKLRGIPVSLSAKEAINPESDKKVKEVAKTVEKLLWQREDDESEQPEVHAEAEEKEAELSLSDAQTKEMAIEHVSERQDEVEAELAHTEPGTQNAAEAIADTVLLEHDESELRGTASFQEALDEALAQARAYIEANESSAQATPEEPQVSDAEVPPASVYQSARTEAVSIPAATQPLQYERGATLPPIEITPSQPKQSVEKPQPKHRGLFGRFGIRRMRQSPAEQRSITPQPELARDTESIKRTISAQEAQIRELAARQYEAQSYQAPLPAQEQRPAPPVEQPLVPVRERTVQAETVEPQANIPQYKSVEMLTYQELMQVSEKIVVEGASLRSIYESRRITEKGLRRLVGEYYRGGNMRKRLAKEMVEKEREFEVDPHLREHFSGFGLEGNGAQAESAAMDEGPQPVRQAEGSNTPAARAMDRVRKDLPASIERLATASPQQMAITAWATLIVVLAVVALVLLVNKF